MLDNGVATLLFAPDEQDVKKEPRATAPSPAALSRKKCLRDIFFSASIFKFSGVISSSNYSFVNTSSRLSIAFATTVMAAQCVSLSLRAVSLKTASLFFV